MPEPLDLRSESASRLVTRFSEEIDNLGDGMTMEVLTEANPEILLASNREKPLPSGLTFRFTEVEDQSWQLTVSDTQSESRDLPVLDVRNLPPERRHEILLATFDELDGEEGFILLNDHDPKPLSHELRSTRGDIFEWSYRRREPGGWRVAIEKTEDDAGLESDVTTTFDIREIPSGERYESIDHRFRMLPEGATMEIIAEEEPRDLHRAFEDVHGDDSTWEIVYADPDEFRVHVTKTTEVESGGAQAPDGVENTSSIDVTEHLDVRDRPPAQRHDAIFETYEALATGEGFILVNDHDPKPLYHQFEAEASDEFHWEYRQREPGEFRVLIGKTPPVDRSEG